MATMVQEVDDAQQAIAQGASEELSFLRIVFCTNFHFTAQMSTLPTSME